MSKFQMLKSRLRDWNLPVRLNAAVEKLPLRHIWQSGEQISTLNGIDGRLRLLNEIIPRQAIESLVNYKDCCVSPQQCRFFSLEIDDKPYYVTSHGFYESDKFRARFPHKLYVTKECALRVKGFRLIRQQCPFKSVRDLNSFGVEEKKKKKERNT